MSILDNEGHDPNGLGNRPTWDNRPGINGVLERKDAEIARLRAVLRECGAEWRSPPGTVMGAAAELGREFKRRMQLAADAINDEQETTKDG